MRDQVLRLHRTVVAVTRWRALATPVRPRRAATTGAIFLASFAIYFLVGQLIHGVGGHAVYNWFFNADPPRVAADITRSHVTQASINASAAHPFLVVLLNPLGALLARLLCGAPLLATLLLCHTAGALANVFVFLTLDELGVGKRVALAGTLLHALCSTQLMLGSIPETAPLTSAALTAALWMSLRHARPLANAAVHTLTYAMNGAMLLHALLAGPALWLGRFPFRRYATRVLLLWVGMAALAAGLFVLQRHHYPGVTVLGGGGYRAYDGYFKIPQTSEEALYRTSRILPHMFSFSVVAPVPLNTGAPARITTFMVEPAHQLARYDLLGGVTVACWALLAALACWGHWWPTAGLAKDRRTRNLALLVPVWLMGAFGFFLCFGDDLLLFSFFWISHLVLFVATGVARALQKDRRLARWVPVLGGTFLALLTINQLVFMARVLRHYG